MSYNLLDFFDEPLSEQQATQLREMGIGLAVDLHSRISKIKNAGAETPGKRNAAEQHSSDQGGNV